MDNQITSDKPSEDYTTNDNHVTSDDPVMTLGDPVNSDDLVTSNDPVTSDDPLTSDDPSGVSLDPPDGGYGWVVVLCGWCSLLMMSGTYSMFGMMYPYILHTFEAGDVYTVAIFTSTFFSLHIICVFAGSLCDMFGCRVVALLGNAIAAVGLIMAAFATNFTVLFIGYGVLTGTGFGMVYIPNVVIIPQYFTAKRSIALGIANSGIGMGMFVYAPITRHLLHVYGWRGTVLMLAALWLHGMITASLLRPLPAPPPPSPLTDAKCKEQGSLSFYSSLPMMPGISSSQQSHLGQSRRSLSVREHADRYTTSQQHIGASYRTLRSIDEQEEKPASKNNNNIAASKPSMMSVAHPSNRVSHGSMNSLHPQRILASQTSMNSDDLHTIGASYLSMKSSSTHVTKSQYSVHSSRQMTPCSVCTRLATTIWNTLDLKAFANIYLLLFTLIMLACGAFSMIPVYLPRKCMEAGLSSAQVATLLSIGGLMDTTGRIFFGILGYRVDYTTLDAICITGTGVCMMSLAFLDSFWYLLFSLVGGYLCFGGYANMCSATVVDFVGVEKFARSYGFVLFGSSLGFLVSGPVVSQIYTVSQSYTVVFVVCGCMQLMGALLCVIVLILRALNCGTIYTKETNSDEV